VTSSEIRQKFLQFFKDRGHTIIPSASLIPENDPTTLFTGSGMQPMVPYLLGEVHPRGNLIADSQKCFRSQDIDEVGDNRHTTFFEMLGNWSLGAYFKTEQISWMFQFLTEELGLDPHHLFITVFRGNEQIGIPRDDEAVSLWQTMFKKVGIEAEAVDFAETNGMGNGRIFYYDETKNWWSRAGVPNKMPVGEPGGPDSEMFWDFGVERQHHEYSPWRDKPCHVNCDCGRFMEIGNNVFMQYQKTETGFKKLAKPNVDFGGGLERMVAACGNDPDMFRIDVLYSIIQKLEKISNKKYPTTQESSEDAKLLRSFRIIADHVRAATFVLGDDFGVVPSNKDQGYIVRRLIRRAIVQGSELGCTGMFTADIARTIIETYADAYPELIHNKEKIITTLEKEEAKFQETMRDGLHELEKIIKETDGKLSAQNTFDLYQSFGLPLEVIQDKVPEIDMVGFRKAFEGHQELSRAAAGQKFSGGLADHSEKVIHGHTATHLLHQALRTVLGTHVGQKGSNITAERLRFDFSHTQKMTPEEIKRVEEIVNEQIKKDLPVHFEVLDTDEANERGAIGIFEDKYAQLGGKIKVYFVGDDTRGFFSKEICGGPHVAHTGEIGSFKIQKEEAVAAGIRRIKAVVD